MKSKFHNHPASMAGLIAGATFMAALTACVTDATYQSGGYRDHRATATVVFEDDYDYYPQYETYYSRNRHEYVYREGSSWVRRPQPAGISASVLLSAPSVRLDFRDAPEKHHNDVIKAYPRHWQPQDKKAHDKNQQDHDSRDRSR